MKTKKCSVCGVVKDIDLFPGNANYKDGHLNHCKECASDKCNALRFRELVCRERGIQVAEDEIKRGERILSMKRLLLTRFKKGKI